jgi:hypothetical protein
MLLEEARLPQRGQDMNAHPTSCTCVAHPLPSSMRVRDALDVYLAENGFTKEGYDSPKTTGSLLGLAFSVPNPPSHQRAVRLHDLHHVATGFGTDHAGEAEISVWQARRGLLAAGMYVTGIVLVNVALGVVLAPRRTLRALRESTPGISLFGASVDYDSLLELSVGELREMLAIPPQGLAKRPRDRHAHAPAVSAARGSA